MPMANWSTDIAQLDEKLAICVSANFSGSFFLTIRICVIESISLTIKDKKNAPIK